MNNNLRATKKEFSLVKTLLRRWRRQPFTQNFPLPSLLRRTGARSKFALRKSVGNRIPAPDSLNSECFWWSLFVSDNFFTYFTIYLLFVLPLSFFLKISFCLVLIIQFLCLFFWIVKVTTNISTYNSWRSKDISKRHQRIRAIHTKLDELRDAMLFNEEESQKYWDILVLLDEQFSKIG
jgi:hypothetical protein